MANRTQALEKFRKTARRIICEFNVGTFSAAHRNTLLKINSDKFYDLVQEDNLSGICGIDYGFQAYFRK